MHMAQPKKIGMSLGFILNSFLSVSKIAIISGNIAIENLRKSNVVESMPFWVSVRTNIPLDPKRKPVIMGKIKYIFLIVSL